MQGISLIFNIDLNTLLKRVLRYLKDYVNIKNGWLSCIDRKIMSFPYKKPQQILNTGYLYIKKPWIIDKNIKIIFGIEKGKFEIIYYQKGIRHKINTV